MSYAVDYVDDFTQLLHKITANDYVSGIQGGAEMLPILTIIFTIGLCSGPSQQCRLLGYPMIFSTKEACEARATSLQRTQPNSTVACFKKDVPTWEQVR
jgi:hypothetical protein